jgi:hypothetical protein
MIHGRKPARRAYKRRQRLYADLVLPLFVEDDSNDWDTVFRGQYQPGESSTTMSLMFDRREFADSPGSKSGRGFQPIKLRRHTRKTPAWALDDNFIREMLVKEFPLLQAGCDLQIRRIPDPTNDKRMFLYRVRYNPKCDCRPCQHYRRAGVWSLVIQICLRNNLPAKDVTYTVERWPEEMRPHGYNLNPKYVRRILQAVMHAAKGERHDGLPRTFGKAGRPRKLARPALSID